MTTENTPQSTEEIPPRTYVRGQKKERRALRLPAWLRRMPLGARIAVIALVAFVALNLVAGAADAIISAGRIHPGVMVGPVKVGAKTTAEAASAINAYVDERAAAPITLKVAEGSWDVTREQVALSVDATGLADAAYDAGRGRMLLSIVDRVRAALGMLHVPLELSADAASMEALAVTINTAAGQPAVDAAVRVEGTTVTRVEPADGTGVSAAAITPDVLATFMADERVLALELGPVPPVIDAQAADQAYADAVAMVSGPVQLYYGEKQWEVPAATIGGWIDFRRGGTPEEPALEAFIVAEDLAATLTPMVAEVGKPARSASFQTANGAVSITPSEDGLQADAGSLAVKLGTVLSGAGERRAEITMQRVEPELTTAEAEAMGVKERLSTFTTDYDSGNKPRVNNIHILADALNGTLIAPGATFAFNETIGPRTAAKGYQEANAIVNGKLVPQLGGGICQVGTTIFNTVFFSGLPVVERHNHSQYISHYPTGRDATVSWGGPDFKFKNDTPNWVLVSTSYTNSTVTISLYGTKQGYEVTYETGAWTDIKQPTIKEVPDPTLLAGARVVSEKGVTGRTCVVTRHVKQNGVEIRTDTFKSVYKPTEEVVRVGTKPASVPTTTTP